MKTAAIWQGGAIFHSPHTPHAAATLTALRIVFGSQHDLFHSECHFLSFGNSPTIQARRYLLTVEVETPTALEISSVV